MSELFCAIILVLPGTAVQAPKAVVDAVKAQYPEARILGVRKHANDRENLYIVTAQTRNQSIQLTLRPDGTIVATAKEIAIRELPAAVERAVRAQYPREGLSRAAQEVRGDKIVYAVILDTGTGTPYEVVLDPRGRILREGWRPQK
jgi:hypothetical protein